MPCSNYQATLPEPKNAHILKLMHFQYIMILGHKHHLHLQTKRNHGKQIRAGYQQDRRWNEEKICKAWDLQESVGHTNICQKALQTSEKSHLQRFPMG